MKNKLTIEEKITLEALREEWQHTLWRVQDQLKRLPKIFLPPENKINKESPYYEEAKGLEDDFNDLVYKTNRILESFKIKDEVLPKMVYLSPSYHQGKSFLVGGKTVADLQRREKECKKVLKIINNLILLIPLRPAQEEELKSLKKLVKEIIEQKLPEYAQDLSRAIDNFENGRLLESVLIAGRVINVGLSKINAKIPAEVKEEMEKLSKKEKKDKWWKEALKILNLEFAEERKILEALKLYRDRFSHQVGVSPSIEETIVIISGSVNLIRKIIEGNL